MKRLFLLFLVMIAALAPMTIAHAQWTKGYRALVAGDGRVRLQGGKDFDIQRVRIDLDKDGDVRVVITGGRESVALSGRWSNGDRDKPKVRFTRMNNRSSSIDGTLEFSHDNGRLERINLSGRAERSDVSLNFTSKRVESGGGDNGGGNGGGTGGSDNFDRLDVRTSGNGSLNIGSDRWQVTAVRVNLQRGGAATITLFYNGRRDDTLEGRWTGNGEIVGLNLDSGLNGRLNTARGTVNRRVKTGGIDTVNISGTIGRQTVNISFRAS